MWPSIIYAFSVSVVFITFLYFAFGKDISRGILIVLFLISYFGIWAIDKFYMPLARGYQLWISAFGMIITVLLLITLPKKHFTKKQKRNPVSSSHKKDVTMARTGVFFLFLSMLLILFSFMFI